MEYLKFMNVIQSKITEQLKPEVSVQIHHALKNNGTIRAGLMFSECDVNVSPTIYLEEFYEQYLRGKSIEALVQDIHDIYDKVKVEKSISCQSLLDFSQIKDKIVYKMIQYETNAEMLKEMPHVRHLDLAMVFYVLVNEIGDGTATMSIKNEHLEAWHVRKDEVVALAKCNMQRLFPVELIKISDFMYVVTNKSCCFGAGVMIYDGIWKKMQKMIGENFYVIPSSVHELILVPESFGMERENICEIVKEINATEVQAEEVLSDQVYFYSALKGELVL